MLGLTSVAIADETHSSSTSEHKLENRKVWTDADTSYALSELHQINLHEIAAGQLAKERGSSNAITAYGGQLHDDHESADRKVEQLAKAHKVGLSDRLPTGSDAEKSMRKLRLLTGADFDQAFLHGMLSGHEKAISMVKQWRKETNDKALRSLFDQLLPTLESHCEAARRLSHE